MLIPLLCALIGGPLVVTSLVCSY